MTGDAPRRPRLSILIPARNEADVIEATIARTAAELCDGGIDFEFVVCDDGSSDTTAAELSRLAAADRRVHAVGHVCNRGKGAALKTAFLASLGDAILIIDADCSTDPEAIRRFLPRLAPGRLLIGSRHAPGAVIGGRQTLRRRLMGRGFRLLTRVVFGMRQSDTQCGFKMMPRDLAERNFLAQRVDGFAWDVELLALAERTAGVTVVELPVRWDDRRASKVSLLRDPIRMFRDVLAVRLRLWLGRYR